MAYVRREYNRRFLLLKFFHTPHSLSPYRMCFRWQARRTTAYVQRKQRHPRIFISINRWWCICSNQYMIYKEILGNVFPPPSSTRIYRLFHMGSPKWATKLQRILAIPSIARQTFAAIHIDKKWYLSPVFKTPSSSNIWVHARRPPEFH